MKYCPDCTGELELVDIFECESYYKCLRCGNEYEVEDIDGY